MSSGKYKNFGQFLAEKRSEKGITLRGMATRLGVSAPYLHDVEKSNRYAPDLDKLKEIVRILCLTKEEEDEMYNLAGETRGEVAPDLPDYILGKEYIAVALRTARDSGAKKEDWLKFVEELKRRNEE